MVTLSLILWLGFIPVFMTNDKTQKQTGNHNSKTKNDGKTQWQNQNTTLTSTEKWETAINKDCHWLGKHVVL